MSNVNSRSGSNNSVRVELVENLQPLVNWNRIISLILPSAQTLTVGRQLVKP